MRDYELVERNLREAMRCFALGSPAGEISETSGLLIANAAVESPVFNAAFPAKPVSGRTGLERLIRAARMYFEPRGLPWSFWVCHHLVTPGMRKTISDVFRSNGLWRAAICPGMTSESTFAPGPDAPGLEFVPVGDAETRMAFAHITATCFRVPASTSVAIYSQPAAWNCGLRGWLGYLDGASVATAATVTAGSVTGLYSVATLPGYRRRGIGEQMTRHALARAREETGVERTVLQATSEGFGLYRRLGFREVTCVTVFASG